MCDGQSFRKSNRRLFYALGRTEISLMAKGIKTPRKSNSRLFYALGERRYITSVMAVSRAWR